MDTSISLFDTHAHLSSPLFEDDLQEVLRRALASNVREIVVVSQSVTDAHAVLNLAREANSQGVVASALSRLPLLHPALGLHPVHVSTISDEAANAACAEIEALLSTHGGTTVMAVGEVGLDFTPRVLASGPGDVRGRQRRVFERLLQAATAAKLPVTIHSRGAGHHALTVVASVPGSTVCMHAFDGRAVHGERAIAGHGGDGIFFSVPPSVVRDTGCQKLVGRLPLEQLLLESDAPALGPVAGERNEPANVKRSVEMIAALKGKTVEQVSSTLHQNTNKWFKGIARNRAGD